MNEIIKWLILNIHTLLLLVGIGFISVSAFLCSKVIGFLVLGVCCVVVSSLINKTQG